MNGLLEKNTSESAPIVTLPIGTYREIPLTRGKVAIVDPEDYEWLSQWKWCAFKSRSVYYAVRTIGRHSSPRMIMMHHLILPRKEGFLTDHINGNGVDNRRVNLRYCTRSQNQYNQRQQVRDKSSMFKGVYFCKERGTWAAQIVIKNRRILIGRFASEHNAAVAYDLAAIKYFGEYARINFQQQEPPVDRRGEVKNGQGGKP